MPGYAVIALETTGISLGCAARSPKASPKGLRARGPGLTQWRSWIAPIERNRSRHDFQELSP